MQSAAASLDSGILTCQFFRSRQCTIQSCRCNPLKAKRSKWFPRHNPLHTTHSIQYTPYNPLHTIHPIQSTQGNLAYKHNLWNPTDGMLMQSSRWNWPIAFNWCNQLHVFWSIHQWRLSGQFDLVDVIRLMESKYNPITAISLLTAIYLLHRP